MKFSLRNIIFQLLFLGLGVYLSYRTVQQITNEDWARVKLSFLQINWMLIPLGVVIMLMSNICRSERWLLLISPEKKSPFSIQKSLNALSAVSIGYFLNLFVPRLGEVVRCTTLSKYENKNTTQLLGTIILERLFDLICLVIIFILVISFESQAIVDYISLQTEKYIEKIEWVYVILFSLLMLGGMVWFLLFLLPKFPKLKTWVHEIWLGFLSFRHVKHKKLFILYTLLMWIIYVASIRFSFMVMGDLPHLGWGVALQLLAVGSVAMIITQGGVGAYPLMAMQILNLNGLMTSEGFSIGWFIWLFMSFVTIFFGLLSYLYFSLKSKKT